MKTSLNLDDSVFRAAQKEARRAGTTLSETISRWARVGRDVLAHRKHESRSRAVAAVDLGGPASVDVNSRRDWMDALDR